MSLKGEVDVETLKEFESDLYSLIEFTEEFGHAYCPAEINVKIKEKYNELEVLLNKANDIIDDLLDIGSDNFEY